MTDLRTPPSTSIAPSKRRLPIGAEPLDAARTHYRVWAPAATGVTVVLDNGTATPLEVEGDGYFSGVAAGGAGTRYRFRVDDPTLLYPDPASRFQPDGPDGPSEVIDPAAYAWADQGWAGLGGEDQVLYEMHVGTFTPEGTYRAAMDRLPLLVDLGITTVELMPVADFAGRFGWGYDGVNLFAPTRLYGRPDDLRRLIDRAHRLGLGVVLDVVYNHFGPVGNYLRRFSPAYFTDRYDNEWGEAINFDGEDAAPVREYFLANAEYWIDEFHFDGLRLDATQGMFDRSGDHIVAAIGRRVRRAAAGRRTLVVAENEPEDPVHVRPESEGGLGLDGLWADDFHHAAMVALTGHAEAYYSDTSGRPQEFVSAAKYGSLFQGQYFHWQRRLRGAPGWGIPTWRFVTYLQNHDQVANSARGLRGHQLASPGRWRAMTTLLLLMPTTPMLFQGQEFAASSPFLFFADFDDALMAAVRKGRAEFLTQFPSVANFEQAASLDNPGDIRTFERSKLDWQERDSHREAVALHRDLLRLRREHAAFSPATSRGVDGAVLSGAAFLLRFFTDGHREDRLLIVNLGRDLKRPSFAEPLIAAPDARDWELLWSSEHPAYGGGGTAQLWDDDRWMIPGESAILLKPGPRRERRSWQVRRRTA
jgi:maltooligosyltrehalose trehalohydrolase